MKKILIICLIITILSCTKSEKQEKLNNFELLNIPILKEKGLFIYQKRFGMGGSIYADIYLSKNCDGPLKNDLKFTHEFFLELNKDTITFYLPRKLYEETINSSFENERGVVFKESPTGLTLYDQYQKGDTSIILIDGYNKQIIEYCNK